MTSPGQGATDPTRPTMLAVVTVLASGGSIVDLDYTVVAQLLIFLVLFLLLRPILFRRMVELLAAREKSIEGARIDAHRMEEESRAKTASYEAAIQKVRTEASVERDRLREEGARTAGIIVGNTRREVSQHIDQGKREIASETARLRSELRPRIQELARELARKLLGRDPGDAA